MKIINPLIAMLIFFLPACGGGQKEKSSGQPVTTARAVKESIERKVTFTGNIEAQDAVEIFPRATGKVAQKLLKEGDAVKKGQFILLVDRDEIGYRFKPMPVDSPINGTIGSILVDVGTNVNTNSAVAIVVRPENMRVKLDIPERYLGAILPGTEVSMKVDSLNDETFNGTITIASPVVDQKTRTAKVEVIMPNPDGRLKHGMFGRMDLVVEKHYDVLTVPYDAISWEGEKQVVYKLADGNKVKRQEVNVGFRNDTKVEITNGLDENDTVIVGDLLDLEDGESVTVTTTPTNEQPANAQ